VTRCGSMATSAGGETVLGRGNGDTNVSQADTNLIGMKNKKIHAFDSVATNRW
jgi:hypothetical protein